MYTTDYLKRSWVEVDLRQLKVNYETYKRSLPQETQIMAVVKADAYGHGDINISKCLNGIGVKLFAVSNLNEAITLRKGGICGEILILGYTPVECIQELVKYDITQALISEEYAESLLSSIRSLKCQFAIDTGMNRIGIDADSPEYCEKLIRKFKNRCNLTGLFTHLCVADSNNLEDVQFTVHQIRQFKRIADSVKDLNMPFVHCLNSAGGQRYTDEWKDEPRIVRLGIILYGLKPSSDCNLDKNIHPILSWKTVISMIKHVKAGESVGYGRNFVTQNDMCVATLPTGYADGYNRGLSNRGFVMIHRRKAPIIGKICMDQMMVNVTGISEAKCGDEVLLIDSENLTADMLGAQINTIGYEVVCAISKRVPRVFIDE